MEIARADAVVDGLTDCSSKALQMYLEKDEERKVMIREYLKIQKENGHFEQKKSRQEVRFLNKKVCVFSRALQKELIKDVFETHIPKTFESLEKILKARGGKHFAGNKVRLSYQ